MAVYTHLEADEIKLWAKRFGLGQVEAHCGVAAGTVNTIYRLDTTAGRFALRLLEDRSRRDANFEAALVEHLRASITLEPLIANMMCWKKNVVHTRQARQHVSVLTWLRGRSMPKEKVLAAHVEQVGQVLRTMHVAQQGFRRQRRCAFDPERMRVILAKDWSTLAGAERAVLTPVQNTLRKSYWKRSQDALEWGIVHGDLFIDNVHFTRGKLTGVLDFEMASEGPLLFDVAVTLCEWAFNDAGRFYPKYAQALLRGYGGIEKNSIGRLYALCLFAAARFTWTRVHDFVLSEREVDVRTPKHYEHFLRRHQKLREMGRAHFIRALGAVSK